MTENKNILKDTLKEISQPFIDLAHTSRTLLGVNRSYAIEGLTYFGVVGLLTIFFNENIGLSDEVSGYMVGFLTAGITLAMLLCLMLRDSAKNANAHINN
jgi:proton-dependent oligopeptide transporter, POT family